MQMNEWQFSIQTPIVPLILFIVMFIGTVIGMWFFIRWWRTPMKFKFGNFIHKHYLPPFSRTTIPLQLHDGNSVGEICRKFDYIMLLREGYNFEDGTNIKRRIPLNLKIGIKETNGANICDFIGMKPKG